MVKVHRQRQQQEEKSKQRKKHIFFIAIGFVLGFVISSAAILNTRVLLDRLEQNHSTRTLTAQTATSTSRLHELGQRDGYLRISTVKDESSANGTEVEPTKNDLRVSSARPWSGAGAASLRDVRIIVAIAAFDFNQIPHLEEVLDSYHDICVGGAIVDVVIHATVAYPVTYIDMLNSRFTCQNFSLDIVLKPSSLRLHLVDCHRELFYNKINDYDLFIYTEEDIRITPRTVSTYLQESQRIREIMEQDASSYSFSDFNVGIVRYEYNFPSNVVIDDKTRHAIQNVSSVQLLIIVLRGFGRFFRADFFCGIL